MNDDDDNKYCNKDMMMISNRQSPHEKDGECEANSNAVLFNI